MPGLCCDCGSVSHLSAVISWWWGAGFDQNEYIWLWVEMLLPPLALSVLPANLCPE